VLTYTFPVLNQLLKASGTFWLYGVICVLGFVFILKKLPETKGRSLEEIEKDFEAGSRKSEAGSQEEKRA
jgi:hypothetical protein